MDTDLIAFKAISNFTEELSECFGNKHHSLKLYRHLIERTQIVHEKAIQKHKNAFQKFCVSNRICIETKNSKLEYSKIEYSEKCFIDMNIIFELADKETSDVIWNHLLCISAIVDPAGKAKKILKENQQKTRKPGLETDFLTNIIDKVEKHIKPDSNPMEAISSIMSSGIFTELVGGMQTGIESGNLDIGSLLGSVQSLMSTIGSDSKSNKGEDVSVDNSTNQMMSMMTTMMNSFSGLQQPNMSTSKPLEPIKELTEDDSL